MRKIGFKILVITLFLNSCSIGKKGVSFKEMGKQPSIEVSDNKIVVNTNNSLQNSALLIYKIDLSIDTIKRVIELRGFQAINKDYKSKFELKVNGLSKMQLDNYEYFWIDPDGSRNKIEKI